MKSIAFKKLSALFAASLMIVSCSKNNMSGISETRKPTHTGGVDKTGRPYTTFSNKSDVDDLEKPVEETQVEPSPEADSSVDSSAVPALPPAPEKRNAELAPVKNPLKSSKIEETSPAKVAVATSPSPAASPAIRESSIPTKTQAVTAAQQAVVPAAADTDPSKPQSQPQKTQPQTEKFTTATSNYVSKFLAYRSIRVRVAKANIAVSLNSDTNQEVVYGVLNEKFTAEISMNDEFNLMIKCDTQLCKKAKVYLIKKGESRPSASALILRETRFVKIITANKFDLTNGSIPWEFAQMANLANSGLLTFEAESTEVFPGRSFVSLTHTNQAGLEVLGIHNEILETQGDCLQSSTSGSAKNVGWFCMAGNSQDGNLVFKYSMQSNPPVWFELLPRSPNAEISNTTLSPVVNPELATTPTPSPNPVIQVSGEVHEYLKPVLQDINRPEIQEAMDYWKTQPTKKVKGGLVKFKTFMGYYADSLNKNPSTDKGLTFKKMSVAIKNKQMPLALSFVSLQESNFSAEALSPRGAYGWWQFMPATATEDFGLKLSPIDERALIEPSTKAAMEYFRRLLTRYSWGGDLRFALAAYNCGPGCISNNYIAATNYVTKVEQMSFDQVASFSLDFWKLYHLGMLPMPKKPGKDQKYVAVPQESKDYVAKILSVIFLAADTSELGHSELVNMPLN